MSTPCCSRATRRAGWTAPRGRRSRSPDACARGHADRRRRAGHARAAPPPRFARLPRAPDLPRVQRTVAADENISPEARALVEAYGADIVWYPKDTYFRPGGIWKKITDQWQAVESEYVAYFHYDDLWDATKLAEQVAVIERVR